jgi:hypothetical protein
MPFISMDNLRQLLVAIAGLTLVFSVVSGTSPNYFSGYTAFAQDDEDEEEHDNNGSSDDEEDDHDKSDRHDDEDRSQDEHTVSAEFGESSKVELEIDTEIEDDGTEADSVEADLEIETEDEDLADGEHDVSLVCDAPDFEKAFDAPLVVEEGEGKFDQELLLANNTAYEGCTVGIGDLDVELPDFRVIASADRDEHDEDDDETGRDEDDDEEEVDDDEAEDDDDDNGRGHGNESKIEMEDGGIEIEVEADVAMADGTYDALFTCEEPEVAMTLEDSLKVKQGEAKLDAEIQLVNGTYTGCNLESGDNVIASFDTFVVRQGEDDDDEDDNEERDQSGRDDDDEEDDDDNDVDEKRKEKRRSIVSTISASDEHRRRINASPASTGDYDPGWNYTLVADGIATPREDSDELAELLGNATVLDALTEEEVAVEMDMSVWKSNSALVLLSVLEGTVQVGGEQYTVELGYALYSVNHDAMRIGAFVSDEDGNIYKLKLRGTPVGDDAAFPTESGDSLDMVFEGNSGPARNSFSGWELDLRGTIEAE